MRIPIAAIVVPLVVLLLYLFVPDVKERPWTALRVAVLGIRLGDTLFGNDLVRPEKSHFQ
jgi:uncharacterized BrkB/YihY/UPF0761 family membrane protein